MLRAGMFLGDRYEVIELIGSGGMAEVYKAKCHKLNRMVAIKVLKAEFCNDKNFVTKFKAEAQAAAGLSHPNIVSIYDVGDEEDIHYIVMELVEGITLKQYIDKKKKLDIKESIGITIQIAQGIGAAHEQHIIHRDIKPQNVIISRDGKVKVTDFGIAKVASSQTINSEAVGSVYYFSPEQARGGYCDERSDIYSLGITLYEMLTGKVPFDGESTVAVALAHLQAEMTPPRELEPMIPISLEKIILKATQKKPERRYASASELIADLRKALLMPEEDFVKVIPVNNTSPTVLISEDEISMIKQSKSIPVEDEEPDDDDNTVNSTSTEYEVEEEVDPDDEEEGKESTVFDRVIFIIGIVVCVLILAIAIFLLARAIKSWNKGTDTSETTTSASIEIDETISDKQTVVPNVEGLTYDEAVSALKDKSLGVKRVDLASDDVMEGLVISQQYAAGDVVDKNITVTLYVSKGSDKITLPEEDEVVGQPATNVKRDLKALGLEVEEKTEYSDTVAEKNVIRIEPECGSQVTADTVITIYTSLGAEIEYISVPNLLGLTEEEADKLLDSTLSVTVESEYSEDTKYKKGQIIAQSLVAETEVEKGSEITITVSKGSEYVDVPDILGKSLDDATKALEDVGLKVGTTDYSYDSEVAKDKIISYGAVTTNSKDQAKIGTAVNIIVSKGSDSAGVPVLTGKTKDDAIKALTDAGLVAGKVTEDYSSTVPSGSVISQGAEAGDEVKIGTKVDFVVSLGVKYVTIPDFANKNYKDYIETLEKLGLVVNAIPVESNQVIEGYVIKCSCLPSQQVPEGSTVDITYAVSPATQAPDPEPAPAEETTLASEGE